MLCTTMSTLYNRLGSAIFAWLSHSLAWISSCPAPLQELPGCSWQHESTLVAAIQWRLDNMTLDSHAMGAGEMLSFVKAVPEQPSLKMRKCRISMNGLVHRRPIWNWHLPHQSLGQRGGRGKQCPRGSIPQLRRRLRDCFALLQLVRTRG